MLVVGCIPNFSSDAFGGRVAGACSVRILARFFYFFLFFFPFCLRFFPVPYTTHSYPPPDLKPQHEEHSHFYKRLRCTVQYLIKAVGSHRDIPHHPPTCYVCVLSHFCPLPYTLTCNTMRARRALPTSHPHQTHSFANSPATYVHLISWTLFFCVESGVCEKAPVFFYICHRNRK